VAVVAAAAAAVAGEVAVAEVAEQGHRAVQDRRGALDRKLIGRHREAAAPIAARPIGAAPIGAAHAPAVLLAAAGRKLIAHLHSVHPERVGPSEVVTGRAAATEFRIVPQAAERTAVLDLVLHPAPDQALGLVIGRRLAAARVRDLGIGPTWGVVQASCLPIARA
jgi:hypothetical protein